MDAFDVLDVDDFLDKGAIFGCKILKTSHVDFVDDKDGGFVGEEGLDRVEEFALTSIYASATILNKVEWKLTWASMEYPHCSLRSMKYRIQLFRWANAVILCISIVFISSSG